MTRFYRFISSNELHTIFANSFTNDMIASEDAAMVHLFKDQTPTIIADHKIRNYRQNTQKNTIRTSVLTQLKEKHYGRQLKSSILTELKEN